MIYLPEIAARKVLSVVASLSAPGSRIIATMIFASNRSPATEEVRSFCASKNIVFNLVCFEPLVYVREMP